MWHKILWRLPYCQVRSKRLANARLSGQHSIILGSINPAPVILMNKGTVINSLLLPCYRFISWHGVEYRSLNGLLFQEYWDASLTTHIITNLLSQHGIYFRFAVQQEHVILTARMALRLGKDFQKFLPLSETYVFFCVSLPHNSCIFRK